MAALALGVVVMMFSTVALAASRRHALCVTTAAVILALWADAAQSQVTRRSPSPPTACWRRLPSPGFDC